MLRPYKLIYHQIRKLQCFVNYLFLEVICKAPLLKEKHPEFTSNMIIEKYRLFIDQIDSEYLLDPLKEIYDIVQNLSPQNIKIIKRAVHTNNRIRELCNGKYTPVLYSDLLKIDDNLSKNIKKFCNNIYENEVNKKAPFQQHNFCFTKYYKKLIGRIITCRCCGIGKILNEFHIHRSALDHYLPKSKYPFVSVNVYNLVPICDTCNSKYKLAKDTLHLKDVNNEKIRESSRIKAFYPFRRETPDIKMSLSLSENCRPDELYLDDITLDFSCNDYQEELDNWIRIFGIENNYKSYLCSEEMFGFLEEDFIVKMTKKESHDDYLRGLHNNKFIDQNFLKIPYFEYLYPECENEE